MKEVICTVNSAVQQNPAVDIPRADRNIVTWQQAEDYLASLEDRGCARDTVEAYRRNLTAFFSALPPERCLRRDTVACWRDAMLEHGYMIRTINNRLSSVNGFLGYIGLREYQLPGQLKSADYDLQPELSRHEYMRLLSTAKVLEKERTYLLVKVFACTGLALRDLPKVTVETVYDGQIVLNSNRVKCIIRIPKCLRSELLCYICNS